MRPHKDSDDLGRLAHGCLSSAVIVLLMGLGIAVACRALSASEPTAVYLPIAKYQPPVGVAWCAACPDVAERLQAHRWYACCHTCPDPNDARIAIIRPNWQWSSICPADHSGYILVGNEDTIPPAAMAQFILQTRAGHPRAHLICLNHFDVAYMTAVLALLPDGTCHAVGVHITHLIGDTAVSDWLNQIPASRFWVTEVGGCNGLPGVYDWLKRVVSEARRHNQVGMVMAYTAVGGDPDCTSMVGGDGELLTNGQAFVDGLKVEEAYYP